MSELLSESAAVDKILATIAEPDDHEAPIEAEQPETVETESPAASAEDAPVEEIEAAAQDQGETETEPQAPALEPPPGLTHDEIEQFKSLPPEAQKIIERRERDRTAELRRGQDEIANQKKAVEQERQRLAQSADAFLQQAQFLDPVLAEGQKTDWAKLAQEDPAGYVQKWAAFQQRAAQVQAAMAQRDQVAQQQRAAHVAKQEKLLLEKIPEWRDPDKGKAGIRETIDAISKSYGLTPEEAFSAAQSDHRLLVIARDAMRYHQLLAAQKTAAEKKVVTTPIVQKPGRQQEGNSSVSARAEALKQRALRTGKESDAIEAVLARI